MLFVADLHYTLRQFDWLTANAGDYDLVIIGGDLLDLGSTLDFDVQIFVVEKYLHRIRQNTRLLVSSGNHDGDSRNAANCWMKAARLRRPWARSSLRKNATQACFSLVVVMPVPKRRVTYDLSLIRFSHKKKRLTLEGNSLFIIELK